MNLPTQDSKVGRGIKTAAQAAITFIVGLAVVIWNVPGVPTAVVEYTKAHFFELALFFGVSTGFTSFIWNLFRKNVPVK